MPLWSVAISERRWITCLCWIHSKYLQWVLVPCCNTSLSSSLPITGAQTSTSPQLCFYSVFRVLDRQITLEIHKYEFSCARINIMEIFMFHLKFPKKFCLRFFEQKGLGFFFSQFWKKTKYFFVCSPNKHFSLKPFKNPTFRAKLSNISVKIPIFSRKMISFTYISANPFHQMSTNHRSG